MRQKKKTQMEQKFKRELIRGGEKSISTTLNEAGLTESYFLAVKTMSGIRWVT